LIRNFKVPGRFDGLSDKKTASQQVLKELFFAVTNAQRNKSCPFILSSEKAKSQRLCRWTTAELITAASKLGSVAKLKLAQRRYGSLWGKHGRRCLFHT